MGGRLRWFPVQLRLFQRRGRNLCSDSRHRSLSKTTDRHWRIPDSCERLPDNIVGGVVATERLLQKPLTNSCSTFRAWRPYTGRPCQGAAKQKRYTA